MSALERVVVEYRSVVPAGGEHLDVQQLKDALASFATGVTVVTACADGQIHGMTANAFCSVSLDPPLVLVCVDKSARMHGFISKSGAFVINVLSSEQEHLARHFSRRSRPILGEFSYAPYTPAGTGAPVLARVAAYLECTLQQAHDAGDHTIYVGAVQTTAAFPERRPLLYHRRQYLSWAPDGRVTGPATPERPTS